MVIAPELELVDQIKSATQATAVDEYITYVKSRSERERMAEKKITGVFTGAYAINPFDGREIPIWISEYVLAGYGTGAIMAVPCGDERDHKFAKHFNISITNIIGSYYNGEEANPTKEAVLENSGFLNGIVMKGASDIVITALEERGIGTRKVNYKMRDAAFSRQRYWGEPFPITWKEGIAKEWKGELPLVLPDVEKYGPGPDGEGPLANIPEWVAQELETNTMPGYAGSSWYFLRYMDPHNNETFCDRKISDYWNQVDIYIGGTEHAVGHLLYSRMWTKVLYDLNLIGFDEPYKRLVNQGMITGKSYFVSFIREIKDSVEYEEEKLLTTTRYFSYSDKITIDEVYQKYPEIKACFQGIDQSKIEIGGQRIRYGHLFVDTQDRFTEGSMRGYVAVNLDLFVQFDDFEWEPNLTENGDRYLQGRQIVEKMSKSKFNVENPDDIIESYGADTFRMYEMFLGPVEMSKPWDTKGIEGVHRFLKKFWRLFADETKGLIVTNEEPTPEELKVLHNTIKKIESDTERFSFNTGVSGFMIATNELTDLKCHKRKILEPLLILLAPYAPHIAEELYAQLRQVSPNGGDLEGASILNATYPTFEEKYVIETSKEYPVSINGKLRTTMNLSLDAEQPDVEKKILENEIVQKWLEGKQPKKIIYVKNKMINVVV